MNKKVCIIGVNSDVAKRTDIADEGKTWNNCSH